MDFFGYNKQTQNNPNLCYSDYFQKATTKPGFGLEVNKYFSTWKTHSNPDSHYFHMPYTCLNCLGEATLRERAKPFCIHQTECTYCSAAGRHADVRDISEIFAEVFETHFTDTSTTLGLENLHCYE